MRSGRRAASERPSVPPWLWPMIATRGPVAPHHYRAMVLAAYAGYKVLSKEAQRYLHFKAAQQPPW